MTNINRFGRGRGREEGGRGTIFVLTYGNDSANVIGQQKKVKE